MRGYSNSNFLRKSLAARRKFAALRAGKDRKRLLSPPPDYPPVPDYSTPVETWTMQANGRTLEFALFQSRKRRDCYRVTINGVNWRNRISRTELFDRLRSKRWPDVP